MVYDWYKVINRAEFEASGLISTSVELVLESVGAKTFLVTKANTFAITVDDVMLAIGVDEQNPFVFGNRALYVDENDDAWYGIPTE